MNKEKIKIDNNVFSMQKIIDVRGDVIVPDIKQDIVNITNTNGISYIYKKDIIDGKIRVDGNLDLYIIYVSETGETRSICSLLNFVESIEDNRIKSNGIFDYNLEVLNIESKILNERKISISAQVKLDINYNSIEEFEIISDLDKENNLQKLQKNIELKKFVGMNTSKTSIKESIKISENDEISEIAKVDISIMNNESKISYNKVLAKAEAQVQIMYLTEDNKVNLVKANLPIMSFIEIENVKDNNICSIKHNIKNIIISPNSKEEHSILVQIEFDVECKVFEKKQINIIQDVYSLENTINCTENEISICSDENANEKINLEEKVFIEDISKVCSIDFFPNILNKNISNGITTYEAEAVVTILYEMDNKLGLFSKQINIPFIIKDDSMSNVKLCISKKDFSLANENVNLYLEIEVIKSNNSKKCIRLVNNIEVKEEKNENPYSMIVYFTKENDTLWNIGKNFKVSVDSICKYNNIEENNITPGKKLYIVR